MSVLISLGLTPAELPADPVIYKKILGYWTSASETKLNISSEEMKGIVIIVNSLEDSILLI